MLVLRINKTNYTLFLIWSKRNHKLILSRWVVAPKDFFLTDPKTGNKYVVSRSRLAGISIVLYSFVREVFSCLLTRLLDLLLNSTFLLLALDYLFYGISISSFFFLSLSKMFVDISRIYYRVNTLSSTLI